MNAALWIPGFHLQAAMRVHAVPARVPAALLEGAAESQKSPPTVAAAPASVEEAVIRQVNEVAETRGVRAGMTAPQGQARCPALRFLHPAPAEEERLHRHLLACAAEVTPFYEHTLPGLCILDLESVRELTGREAALAADLHRQLTRHGLEARVGLARLPDLAMLAAQAANPVLTLRTDADAAAFLHGLPVTALRPPPAMAEILTLWGIHTLGQFVSLPRPEVAARLGTQGTLLWDMASGGHMRLLQLVRPPARYAEVMELEHGIETLEPLMLLLRRMLENLCARLAEAWLVAGALRLVLRFENGAEHRAQLRVAEPCRAVDLLQRLLHTHLEGLTARAPICALSLQLQPVRPPKSQGDLFQRGLRDPNRFAETLGQLEALLGQGNVGRARLLPSRHPDAFTLDPFLAPHHTPLPAAATEEESWTEYGLPLRRCRPAPEVRVRLEAKRPAEFATASETFLVRKAAGPWLLSGQWWDNSAWQREIWTVSATDGGLYQLALEHGRWFLDGILG